MKILSFKKILLAGVAVTLACTALSAFAMRWQFHNTTYLRLPKNGVKWKAASQGGNGASAIKEFVPRHQSINNWHDLITIQDISFASSQFKGSALQFVQALETMAKRSCQKVEWRYLAKRSNSVTYEWQGYGCRIGGNQHEIARVMTDKQAFHRVAYTTNHKLSRTARSQYLRMINSAFLGRA